MLAHPRPLERFTGTVHFELRIGPAELRFVFHAVLNDAEHLIWCYPDQRNPLGFDVGFSAKPEIRPKFIFQKLC
jgi:hypothetical protein